MLRLQPHIANQKQKTTQKMQIDDEFVADWLHRHQAQTLIHGHIHQRGEHTLPKRKKRIVLPAWHDEPLALKISANAPPEFINIEQI